MDLVDMQVKVLEEKGDMLKICIGRNYITLSKAELFKLIDPAINDPIDAILRNIAVYLVGANTSITDEKTTLTAVLDNVTFKAVV